MKIGKKNFGKESQMNDNYINEIYDIIIKSIVNEKNQLLQKTKYTNKIYYPINKTHRIIERLMEEEKQRKLDEERRLIEKQRYEKERKMFKDEDMNIYKEVEEKESSESLGDEY